MASKKNDSQPLESFTEEQLANLGKSINTLDQEDERWNKEQKEEEEERRIRKIRLSNISFYRLRKSPLEITNRLLFIFFLGSFLFSFISVYASNRWWFIVYLVSAFSSISYTPNRKALKELIAAWANVENLIKKRILSRK